MKNLLRSSPARHAPTFDLLTEEEDLPIFGPSRAAMSDYQWACYPRREPWGDWQHFGKSAPAESERDRLAFEAIAELVCIVQAHPGPADAWGLYETVKYYDATLPVLALARRLDEGPLAESSTSIEEEATPATLDDMTSRRVLAYAQSLNTPRDHERVTAARHFARFLRDELHLGSALVRRLLGRWNEDACIPPLASDVLDEMLSGCHGSHGSAA